MTEPNGDNPLHAGQPTNRSASSAGLAINGTLDSPGPDEFGTVGSWYFLHQPEWIERHVETLELLGGRSAFRRLTIDLILPSAPEAWIADGDGTASYCIPVARLAKDEPTSFIDMSDEQGTTLPLLTRRANAILSARALRLAVSHLIGEDEIDPVLDEALKMVVEDDGLPAEIASGIYKRAAATISGLSHGPAAERLAQVVSQLQANSFVWVSLRGRPSSRRVLKLCYRISLAAPIIPARRTETDTIEELGLDVENEGPIDLIESGRQMFSRFTAAAGWDAIDLRINDPMTQDPQSYHFQVQTPAGLQVSEIAPDWMPTGEYFSIYSAGEHLYMSAADPGQLVPLTLRLRVQRRGLLNLSMLTTFFITGLLWFVTTHSEHLDGSGEATNAQLTGGVLLVAPAFLVLFTTRPAENALASALLTGVRSSVLLCGLCASASAAAIGGVRPFDSLQTSLIVTSGVASAATLTVLIAWFGSWRLVREQMLSMRHRWWGDRRHGSLFLSTIAICPALLAALAGGLYVDAFSLTDVRAHGLTAAGVLAAIAALVFVCRRRFHITRAAVDQTSEPQAPVPIPWAHHGVFAVSLVAAVCCVASLVFTSRAYAGAAVVLCLSCCGLLVTAATANLLEPLPEPDEEEWADEWDVVDEWVGKLSDGDSDQDTTKRRP
jgi:hypothetical protein